MNGEVNCILSVCCPEGSDAQVNALAGAMARDLELQREMCRRYATWVLTHFDLAEKGTLAPFKASIARLAREPRHEG